MTTRNLELNRTVAALIDAHIRWNTSTVDDLIRRDDDPRWAPDLAYVSARVALALASRIGDHGITLAATMQVWAAPRISDEQLADPEIRHMVEEGIREATQVRG